MTSPPTTPLAATQSFAAALCLFQAQAADHGATASLLASAHEFGFSWFSRPATDALGTQVVLCHVSGATHFAHGDQPAQLLLGLLGGGFSDLYAVTIEDPAQPAEPGPEPIAAPPEPKPDPEPKPEPKPEPPAAQVAAESLAAATGGTVFELAEGDPDLTQLTDDMKAQAKQMVAELTAHQRKSFAIAFRNAFNVDKEEKSIIPLITQIRHAKFINDFTIEANGGVAP
jgi:hypothetical protein